MSARLPFTDHQRKCVLLRAPGLRHKEIAWELGIALNSVRKSLNVSQKKLGIMRGNQRENQEELRLRLGH